MNKISIIMPVYNKEKYVARAIESILKQTLTAWELLIIDDGSTDSSYEICKKYQDNRIRLVHVENGGVSKARNIGLDMAQGEYVTFVDSDDYVAVDYLQNLYVLDAEMVIGGLRKVNLRGIELGNTCPKLNGKKTIQETAKSFYVEQLTSGIYGFVASKMIKREIIERNKLRFSEHIRLAEDYNFFLDVYNHVNEIVYLDYAGYFYVQETENSAILLDDSRIDFLDQIEIQKKAKGFVEKQGFWGTQEEKLFLERVTGYVYTILLQNTNLNYKELTMSIRKLKECVPKVSYYMSGIGRVCISFYDKDWKVLIYIFLKMRKLVRKLCQN